MAEKPAHIGDTYRKLILAVVTPTSDATGRIIGLHHQIR